MRVRNGHLFGQNPGMENPAMGSNSGTDWTGMLSALFQGTGGGLSKIGQKPYHGGQQDAKEARRRSMSDMMRRSMGRNQSMMQSNQQYGQQNQDMQNELMRQMAQGFIESMRGGM